MDWWLAVYNLLLLSIGWGARMAWVGAIARRQETVMFTDSIQFIADGGSVVDVETGNEI